MGEFRKSVADYATKKDASRSLEITLFVASPQIILHFFAPRVGFNRKSGADVHYRSSETARALLMY